MYTISSRYDLYIDSCILKPSVHEATIINAYGVLNLSAGLFSLKLRYRIINVGTSKQCHTPESPKIQGTLMIERS